MNLNNISETVINALYILPAMLISLPFHECAHGYIANKLGDPTARMMGRLTLNPIKHLDPIGFLCMLICGFGWAKPVPVNPNNFKKPKRDMAITSLAGPVSNLILGIVGVLILVISEKIVDPVWYYTDQGFWHSIFENYLKLVLRFSMVNVGLMVFNLIPVVPLDGSRILYFFLPNRIVYKIQPYEKYIQIGLFVLVISGILGKPLSYAMNGVFNGIVVICEKVTAFI